MKANKDEIVSTYRMGHAEARLLFPLRMQDRLCQMKKWPNPTSWPIFQKMQRQLIVKILTLTN